MSKDETVRPKLTKAQVRVILTMRTHVLHFTSSGRYASYSFDPPRRGERAPSALTIHALYKAGLVFQVKDGVGSFHYELTDLGREASNVKG